MSPTNTATAIETTTQQPEGEPLDGLLTALGPGCALVMSYDVDGLPDWADCAVLPTGAEASAAPPVSHERLAS